jgi:hypothetical protein
VLRLTRDDRRLPCLFLDPLLVRGEGKGEVQCIAFNECNTHFTEAAQAFGCERQWIAVGTRTCNLSLALSLDKEREQNASRGAGLEMTVCGEVHHSVSSPLPGRGNQNSTTSRIKDDIDILNIVHIVTLGINVSRETLGINPRPGMEPPRCRLAPLRV